MIIIINETTNKNKLSIDNICFFLSFIYLFIFINNS